MLSVSKYQVTKLTPPFVDADNLIRLAPVKVRNTLPVPNDKVARCIVNYILIATEIRKITIRTEIQVKVVPALVDFAAYQLPVKKTYFPSWA